MKRMCLFSPDSSGKPFDFFSSFSWVERATNGSSFQDNRKTEKKLKACNG